MNASEKLNKIEGILASVDKLPTLPAIYAKLTKLLQPLHATAPMIGNVIAEDQAIAVRVLKIVNSAFILAQ